MPFSIPDDLLHTQHIWNDLQFTSFHGDYYRLRAFSDEKAERQLASLNALLIIYCIWRLSSSKDKGKPCDITVTGQNSDPLMPFSEISHTDSFGTIWYQSCITLPPARENLHVLFYYYHKHFNRVWLRDCEKFKINCGLHCWIMKFSENAGLFIGGD